MRKEFRGRATWPPGFDTKWLILLLTIVGAGVAGADAQLCDPREGRPEFKKRTLVENASILGEQLAYAYKELQAAEIEYETFRVSTITLPSEDTP